MGPWTLKLTYIQYVSLRLTIAKRHLEFFELLKNHVVWHVVKEAVARRQDDVTELHVEGGAVSGFGAEVREGDAERSVTRKTRARCVWALSRVELSRSGVTLKDRGGVDEAGALNLAADLEVACPCQTQRGPIKAYLLWSTKTLFHTRRAGIKTRP